MYERNIFLPPSGPAPGVLRIKRQKAKPQNQGHNTITTSIEKHRTRYSIVLSKDKPHKLSCLLRCAEKHIACENQKTKDQKKNPKTLRASQLFTVCDTSALACWQYTHLKQVSMSFKTHRCLLRCAHKHCASALKTKDKVKSVKALWAIPFGSSTILPASLRVQSLIRLCACFAARINTKELSSKTQTHKRQNPVESNAGTEKASVVLSIRCGYSHHECHACYASHISTKLLILLFY